MGPVFSRLSCLILVWPLVSGSPVLLSFKTALWRPPLPTVSILRCWLYCRQGLYILDISWGFLSQSYDIFPTRVKAVWRPKLMVCISAFLTSPTSAHFLFSHSCFLLFRGTRMVNFQTNSGYFVDNGKHPVLYCPDRTYLSIMWSKA